jgi:hypothetical protein
MIPYGEVTAAFAVDVSWSTNAGILDQEKEVVETLAKHLSATARGEARVLPWNYTASSPITLSSIDQLTSSGGTDPTVLNTDSRHHQVLRNCSLWFLLTDGQIDQTIVKDFALGIGESGLHGKASVIILFGYRPYRPISCSISVGQAVFAVAPDCAFLFHDIVTEEVFIFQCKGCFRKLLPQENMQIVLNSQTSWHELPQTSYEKLAQLTVPRPRQVGTNAVFLGSGRVVNLEDLYGNRLDRVVAAEILDNDDDLKSVLLTAQNRGKSREIEDWISKQRMSRKATEYFDRPDVHDNASKLVNKLVMAMKTTKRDPKLERALRRNLREAHLRNWTTFISSISSTEDQMAQRNTVVNDALARVKLNREYSGSPVMMSPVSPRPSDHSTTLQRPQFPTPQPSQPHYYGAPPSPPQPSHAQLPPRSSGFHPARIGGYPASGLPPGFQPQYGRGYMNYSASNLNMNPYSTYYQGPKPPAPSPFSGNAELSQLLYMKGYKLGSGPAAAQPFRGNCELCEDNSSPLALLLKAKPADCGTEGGFPDPNSHAEIKFPLAMGGFPETEIISSFLCCEKCAYFIRRLGTSPVDDGITGVVPLVPLSNEMNRDSTLKEIDAALKGRFHLAIVDQTFLAILYSKLDEVMTEDLPGSERLIKALRWECKNFISQISLPASLSTSFDPSEDTVCAPLSSTMSAILPTIDTSGPNNLVYYPVDGFITLLKGILDLGLMSPSDDLVKKAVFQRLLFHLAEQQSMLRDDIGIDAATEELGRVLAGEVGGLSKDRFCAEVEALEGTYLLESDACESFRRLRQVFDCIERDCGIAIRLFLQLMKDLPWKDGPAEELFDMAKAVYGDSLLFTAPWNLQKAECDLQKAECMDLLRLLKTAA